MTVHVQLQEQAALPMRLRTEKSRHKWDMKHETPNTHDTKFVVYVFKILTFNFCLVLGYLFHHGTTTPYAG